LKLSLGFSGKPGKMRDRLYKFYWRLEKKMVPGLRSSQYEYFAALSAVFPEDARWLDVGCGHNVFTSWMTTEERQIVSRARFAVGIDLDLASIRTHQTIRDRALCTLENLPFPPDTFNVVSANMVVEHVEDPAAALHAIHRVLKPSGVFAFHTTNRRNPLIRVAARMPQSLKNMLIRVFENRASEDVYPTWYRFNLSEQIRAAAAEANFEVVNLNQVSTSALTVMLGPLVALELLWIRWIGSPGRAGLRTNIVGVLRKPGQPPSRTQ
jgi:ubiquinone/menaquinone biosynthesis C-methylase UbiE